MLDAFLVSDAEEPGGETGVVAQAIEMTDGGRESFLDEIESGGVVADKFCDVGVERKLAGFEELIPGGEVVSAGSAEKAGIGWRHVGVSQWNARTRERFNRASVFSRVC